LFIVFPINYNLLPVIHTNVLAKKTHIKSTPIERR
jgi:hypothetical protein